MEKLLKQYQINSLYHFTQAENLPNIFKHGLLPRDILDSRKIYSYFNDDCRYDKYLNAVCMSIEFPNYKMFYALRQSNPDIDWAVLKLYASILCDFHCAYCWTNAASSVMSKIPIEEREGLDAFLGLFGNQPNYPRREELNIPDNYPTNPQAEVLVFGTIPIKYIHNVYFEKLLVLNKYRAVIPNSIKAEVFSSVFSCRNDWKFWQN